MKRVKLKQGTLTWELARESRIGSSEVFDIVRYYATDEELQNCGINAEKFKSEAPYTTAWALYHKMKRDGLYKRGELAPEFAEYGHVVEPYGLKLFEEKREKKLKAAPVYANERLIVSLDAEGVAEESDIRQFDYGEGEPKVGQRFAVEQKTVMKKVTQGGIPFKYIVQAQYQIMEVGLDFFVLQFMMLKEDSPFIRGQICAMMPRKRKEYLDKNCVVSNIYFANNEHLGALIKVCIERFFNAVENDEEPEPMIEYDNQASAIESLRLNTFYNDKKVENFELGCYIEAKRILGMATREEKNRKQEIVSFAFQKNASRFKSEDGTTAFFDKAGRLHVREPGGEGDQGEDQQKRSG